MRNAPFVFNLRTMNPLSRLLFGVLAVGVLGFFLVFGLFMLAVFAGIALVAGTVLAIRGWWLGRRLGGKPAPGDPIEGEFVIVERRTLTRRRPDDDR